MTYPDVSQSELVKLIEQLKVHDHLCLIYGTREEQLAAVMPFIRIGLERGEQCLYVADENTTAYVLEKMRGGGIDVNHAIESGALTVVTKRESYLKSRVFDPDSMLKFLKETVASAKKDGFSALRVAAEMTWALGSEPGLERLMEYEAKLSIFYPEYDIVGICQYNSSRFKPEIILDVIRTHPTVVYGSQVYENFYYVPPDVFLKPKDERIFCEVERYLSNLLERRRAEEKLRQYAEELRRSNNELQHFAYVASHDLQEPLRMISSYLKLIKERYQGKLDKDTDEFIAFAVDGASRLQEMITGLLDYSRVETKARSFKDVNTSEVLATAILHLEVMMKRSEALITSDSLPVVKGDAGQLVLVFQNLISNAIKFKGNELPRIHVSAEEKDMEWLFSLKDNGIGISPEYKDRLFNIFQRLHGREYPGVGIGLSVCRKIIERHDGKIWLESEDGKGTTFYFTIPK
ncbi:MAG TPA: MEDS domain-containing protein [Thermodesulfovibrionales bacterium]|nr:MEDS domain-containing protein [Thermodesulfovibrionales bacterium]